MVLFDRKSKKTDSKEEGTEERKTEPLVYPTGSRIKRPTEPTDVELVGEEHSTLASSEATRPEPFSQTADPQGMVYNQERGKELTDDSERSEAYYKFLEELQFDDDVETVYWPWIWNYYRLRVNYGEPAKLPPQYRKYPEYRERLEALHPNAIRWLVEDFITREYGGRFDLSESGCVNLIACKPIDYEDYLDRQIIEKIEGYKQWITEKAGSRGYYQNLCRTLEIIVPLSNERITTHICALKEHLLSISQHLERETFGYNDPINDLVIKLLIEEQVSHQELMNLLWLIDEKDVKFIAFNGELPVTIRNRLSGLLQEALIEMFSTKDFSRSHILQSTDRLFGVEVLKGCLENEIVGTDKWGAPRRMNEYILSRSQPHDDNDLVEAQVVLQTLTNKELEDFCLSYTPWAPAAANLLETPQLAQLSKWFNQDLIDRQRQLSAKIGSTAVPYEEFSRLDDILEGMDAKRLKGIMKRWLKGRDRQLKERHYFMEAYMGWNKDKVLQQVQKRNKLAFYAYGILPLESKEEVLERYVLLKQWHKEAKKFGMQRRKSEQTALEATLEYLAHRAGEPIYLKFEWQMEAQIAGGDNVDERPEVEFQAGDYKVWLDIEKGKPVIRFEKGGKVLKSVPKAIKKDDRLVKLQAYKQILRHQVSRYREALEGCMLERVQLGHDELEILQANPVAKTMVERLVFNLEGQDPGSLWMLKEGIFSNEHGENMGIDMDTQVTIPHPLDLSEGDGLSRAQQWIVSQEITQPFKQVFRERYQMTTAEGEDQFGSKRFLGQELKGKVVARLLAGRGYAQEETEPAYRHWSGAGVTSYIDLGDNYHFLEEGEFPLETEDIFFANGKKSGSHVMDGERLELSGVDPIVFSETMRDMDLVVSVAQWDEPAEMVARTGPPSGSSKDLVKTSLNRIDARKAIMSALFSKDPRVMVPEVGEYLEIEGKLHQYRIELGRANVFLLPEATHICIIPSRKLKAQEKLYLPFEEKDEKTAEVLSKIYLLLEDNKIKDEIIIEQIG